MLNIIFFIRINRFVEIVARVYLLIENLFAFWWNRGVYICYSIVYFFTIFHDVRRTRATRAGLAGGCTKYGGWLAGLACARTGLRFF